MPFSGGGHPTRHGAELDPRAQPVGRPRLAIACQPCGNSRRVLLRSSSMCGANGPASRSRSRRCRRSQGRSLWLTILGCGPPFSLTLIKFSAINQPIDREVSFMYAKSAHSYMFALSRPSLGSPARSATGRSHLRLLMRRRLGVPMVPWLFP
jgi:hypothetical protein